MLSSGFREEGFFLSEKIYIKKRFTNSEIFLYHYFYRKTNIYPENVIIIKNFIFFFVSNKDYFDAKISLNLMRKELKKKILIIRKENNLIKLLFSFFPDPYIHDIKVGWNIYSKKRIINICFLSFEERGIAVGRSGEYIKSINEIFKKYIKLENSNIPIKISCELVQL